MLLVSGYCLQPMFVLCYFPQRCQHILNKQDVLHEVYSYVTGTTISLKYCLSHRAPIIREKSTLHQDSPDRSELIVIDLMFLVLVSP